MTRLQIADVLNKIMINNRFSIIDRDNCNSEFESQINSMQDIFKLKKQSDITYLYAVSELLSDDFENINNFLLEENKDSSFIQNIQKPTRTDKLLVATAFEENLEFFSMAWNWVAIVTAELAEQSQNYANNENFIIHIDCTRSQIVMLNHPVYASAAGVPGFNNITRIPIELSGKLFGELEIRGNSETEEIVFVLSIDKEYQTLIFELTIDFEVNNSIFSAVIEKKDSAEDEVRSEPVQVDFTKGLKLRKVNWKSLQDTL